MKTVQEPTIASSFPAPTAFVFSGGGSRGAYQVGVWQGLRELDQTPGIVTGTSVGSINAALVAQDSFDLAFHLWKELETNMVFDLDEIASPRLTQALPAELKHSAVEEMAVYAKAFVTQGGVGSKTLERLLHDYIDEEKIRRSPIEYGLVTASLPLLKPCYLYKEQISQGKLIPFIIASSSFYPAIQSCEIDGVKYVDGGYVDNLPVQMALDRNAASVIAIDLNAIGIVRKSSWTQAPHLHIIQSHWDLGNLLIFNRDHAERIMNLGHWDCLKSFGFFDGMLYCFAKGAVSARLLPAAEAAGRSFDLDPSILYTKTEFNRRLLEAVKEKKYALQKELHTLKQSISNPTQALGSFAELLKNTSGVKLVFFLADILRENPDSQTLLRHRTIRSLVKTEYLAAHYLLTEHLLPEEPEK